MKKIEELNVLLVDDEELIRIVLKKALERFVNRVDLAQNAKEALNLFNSESYDIVLTDIRMPDMSGDTLIKKIRVKNQEIPIIVISAYDPQEFPDLDTSLIQGIQKKPIAPTQIKKAFEKIFST